MGRKKIQNESDEDYVDESSGYEEPVATKLEGKKRLIKGADLKGKSKKGSEKKSEAKSEISDYGRFKMRDEKEEEDEASGVKQKKGKNVVPLTNYFSKSGKNSEKEKEPKKPIVPLPKKEKKKKNWDDEDDEWNFNNKEDRDSKDNLDFEDDLNSDDELLRRFQEMKAGSNQKPSVVNTVPESKKINENKQMNIEVIAAPKRVSPPKSRAKASIDEKSLRGSGMEIEMVRGTRPQSTSKEEPSKKMVAEKTSSKNTKKVKGKQVSEDEGEEANIIQGVLSGMAFVITGELISVNDKKDMQEMIKVLGGRAMSDVSKKTTHLIYGHKLMDGREPTQSNKYQKAEKLKLPMMSEEQFAELLMKKTNMSLTELLEGGAVTFAKSGQANTLSKKMDEEKPEPKNEKKNADNKKGMEEEKHAKNELWTDKYAPNSTGGIIGNEGIVNKLKEWLQDWDDVIIRGNKKEIKFKGGFNKNNFNTDNVNARAVLLSGPPGTGKTTLVRLIARELGFNLIEQNASDLRNKSAVKGTLSTLTENRSLNGDAELGRSVILMDEVDGMSSDRGGTQMLNDYIKKTRVPIICIANDRQHPKMRTLAGNCYDLRFQKPNKAKLIHRIKEICSKEGVTVDENSVQHLVDEMNSDVRQILGFLQMYTRTNKTFIYATFKTKSSKFAKDKAVTISNFDAATILLNREQRRGLRYREQMDMFFIDYDLVPLLVQENYLNSAEKTSDLDQLKRIHRAADSIARADISNQLIRREQNWKLLDTFGFNSSLYPAHLVANFCPFAQFPQFYGKFSSEKKMQREIRELSAATMGAITGSRESIKFDYAPAILNLLRYHLKKGTEDSIGQAFTVYENYGLTPDLVKEHLIDIIFNPLKSDLMDGIDTKAKTALTRMYNNRYKDSIKLKKKRQAIVDEEMGDIEEEGEEEEGDEDSEDSFEVEQAKATKKTVNNASKGTAGATKAGKGKK